MCAANSNRAKVRNTIKAIQEAGQANHEAAEAMQGLPEALASTKSLIGKEESTTTGKKLIKVGTFLIVGVPEPFISDITGTALVATGLAMNRLSSRRGNVMDFYRKFQGDLREIERLRREISSFASK